MTRIIVEYDSRKCIGAQKCVEISPQFFSFEGEKAILQGAQQNNEKFTLQVSCNPTQLSTLVKAGESCPVNAIKVINDDEKKVLVETEISVDRSVQTISAQYDDLKEFVMDPYGYFLIRIDPEKKVIEVGLCRELNKVAVKVIGTKPLDIYQTIIKHHLISRFDHAAYLGRELQKAYIALQKRIPYVQDDELVL